MKSVVLFDLDGTVLDSKPGIFRSAAFAMKKLALPMPDERDMMAFLGPPLSDGFAQVCRVPDERVADAVWWYREYYNGGGKFEASIYPGVSDLLTALRAAGKRCFITTSKPHIFARQILEHFAMADLFDGIYGAEMDGTRGKKSEVVAYCLEQNGVSAQDAVLVGDRHFDVNGAKMLSIPCIGVLYGYGTKEELEAAGAVALADCPGEVLKIMLTM